MYKMFSTLNGMKKPPLKQRLQIIMDAKGWKQSDLARAAGCSRGAVTNWMTEISGEKKNIDPRFALNLQEKALFNARWILYGEGPAKMVIVDPEDEQLFAAIRELPPERKRALLLALGL